MSAREIPDEARVKKMKADDLRALLNSIRDGLDESANDENGDDPEPTLKDIWKEIRSVGQRMDSLSDSCTREHTSLKRENQDLKSEVDYLKKAVLQHQAYLESIESQKREDYLIMYGLPEGILSVNGTNHPRDSDKVKGILSAIDHGEVGVEDIKRLGHVLPDDPDKPRPTRIQLTNAHDRKSILDNARRLKDIDGLKRIYIKKDHHPKVRRENERIRAVLKGERDKAVNQGRNVRYDPETRSVMVDDRVVDRFNPQFF